MSYRNVSGCCRRKTLASKIRCGGRKGWTTLVSAQNEGRGRAFGTRGHAFDFPRRGAATCVSARMSKRFRMKSGLEFAGVYPQRSQGRPIRPPNCRPQNSYPWYSVPPISFVGGRAGGIRVHHSSPNLTRSCIANRESPAIACPALLSSRACRPRALATATSIASPVGSGTHVSKILARLSTKAKKACWARPRRKMSRLICSIPAASRSSDPMIVSSRPLNSWSIAALRNALGLA
jgi:hypothetical protein